MKNARRAAAAGYKTTQRRHRPPVRRRTALLNHLAVLHVHRDRLYNIDIDVIAREFVAKSENRLAIFGRI